MTNDSRRLQTLLTIAAGLAVAACAPEPATTAYPISADAVWHAHCIKTPDQSHRACFGPAWEANRPRDPKRFDYYALSVDKVLSATEARMLFSRRLETSEVHPELLTTEAKEVVRYDPATGEFVFHVARQPVIHVLHDR